MIMNPTSVEPVATLQDDKAPKFGLANIPLDIFLDVVRFLDVQHTLRLRRVST